MGKFDRTKNINNIEIDNNIEIKPEYKKMLNNLLGINSKDNTIFASSKLKNYDLYGIIGEKDYDRAFYNSDFKIEIINKKDFELIDHLSKTKTIDEFIELIDLNSVNVSITDRKLLEKDFFEHKNVLLEKIKKQNNQIISKWKRIRNRYLDIQSQTNSWPFYIGSMFIKVKTSRTTLYAPLILKKVTIEITPLNKIYIKSIDSSIDINQKLLFLLQNEYKFNLPFLNNNEKFSFYEVISEFKISLEKIENKNFDFKGKFNFLTKGEVKNTEIKYSKGLVLMFASPLGGELRNKLLNLIKNDETDKLLDIDPLRNIENEVEEKIKNGESILRIQPTDLSQDKAIIGSMIDSSIIWGPPGTGKSQTIANIIANLMIKNKRVIITSEKKAALDVIKNRMGKLSKYIFFGLVDKDINKDEFYQPFKELVKKIKEVAILENNNFNSNYKSIDDVEKKYLKQKENLSNENIDDLIYLYSKYNKNNYGIKKLIKKQDIVLNSKFFKNISNYNDFNEAILNENIEKTGLIFKRYPKDVLIAKKILNKNFYIRDIKNFLNIKDIKNYFDMENYFVNENLFRNNKKNFENDIDYIDYILAKKFREKVLKLSNSIKYEKKIKTFLKNCSSGFRIPFKFINLYKDIIDELFDIFVSTPRSLASIINMDEIYDYVIFDEASQMHIENGIPFISIANKSIIAGDIQQMQPTNYFSIRDISNFGDEDNEENAESLLDFAYRKGLSNGREYMLNKNYRSLFSDLMLFSSKEFYNSNLDVIDSLSLNNNNCIEIFDVDGKWEGRVNEIEGERVIEKVLENINNYDSIIILTLNSTQKQFIESLIYNVKNKFFSEDVLENLKNGKIKLRNLENIQGDEADLVIVSVAYDKNAKLGSTYVARPEGRNALNVAISRAKEKMIIFKSIYANEISDSQKNKSINTFKSWLKYLEMNEKERKESFNNLSGDKSLETFDSTFEEEVYDYFIKNIKTKGTFFIQTQYSVGSYRIDIVFIRERDNKFILGVEVDGYKYHSGYEKIMKDIERQRFLELKNYPIYRITELNWKLNKNKEIERILKLIR